MSRKSSSKYQKEGSEVLVPDVPDSAVKLKVDHQSGNIRIDEEALLRALQKLRTYIKASTDNTLSALRSELDSGLNAAKKEVMVNVQESIAELDSDVKTSRDAQEERMKSFENELSTLQGKMSKMGSGGKSPRKASIEESPDPEPRQGATLMRSQTVKMDNVSYASEPPAKINRSFTAGGEMNFGDVASIRSEPALGSGSRLDSDDDEVPFGRKNDDKPPAISGMNWASEQSMGDVDLGSFRESFLAVQAQLSSDKDAIRLLEGRLEGDVMELSSKLESANEERRNQSTKLVALEKKLEDLEIEAHESSKAIMALREHAVQDETLKAMKESIRDMQDQVNELNVQVAQAAIAEVVDGRIDGMSQKVEFLVDSCQKADAERSAAADNMVELQANVSACTEKLLKTASYTEMDGRYKQLDQQCRGVNDLMRDVQSTLGDISTAVVALGSKAEKSELALMRGELSTIAEGIKEREQTVLFGARCLSCNRVFDDVRPDCGTVDLPGERQRDALFAEVQRALHSPKMDPTAKIKMLAVKVGRPMSVPSVAGSFAGRDAATFACGVGDVQLVPVRGNAIAGDDVRPPPKPEGTPRVLKRRFKAGDTTWQGGTKEGPLDFKHPLSQLVDRSNRFITTVS